MTRARLVIFVLAAITATATACSTGGDAQNEMAERYEEQAEQPAEPAGPAFSGKLESMPVTSGDGFQQAKVLLMVDPAGNVSGAFTGGYEDKPFEIPLEGKLEGQALTAAGQVASHDVRLAGTFEGDAFQGEVTGKVFATDIVLPVYADTE